MTTTPSIPVLNQIVISNQSGLYSKDYTVWVAGFMQDASSATTFYILDSSKKFKKTSKATAAPFIDVSGGLTVDVLDITNSGNNRLVFTVTKAGTAPGDYPLGGFTAYPFNNAPGVSPPGPYDIFEFGPNAQYDVSAVDSFGINLSFAVSGDTSSYGPLTTVSREQISSAFSSFTSSDPNGSAFSQLLYTSPTGKGYPDQIDGQFTAIVSPKDWLAIYPSATGLSGYWDDTVTAFFTKDNQLSLYLNGATVGTYTGSCDGTQYTLSGPDTLSIVIPKSDFAGNQAFIQAVRAKNSGETDQEYAAFGQIEAAIFEAFSRGVALDGVFKASASEKNTDTGSSSKKTIHNKNQAIPANYSSDAWINTANWFTDHKNSYNQAKSLYDVYAKFFHYSSTSGAVGNTTIFGQNSSGKYGMAYGFSLDENPNVGSSSWPASENTPSKTLNTVGRGQTVTITIGLWATLSPK